MKYRAASRSSSPKAMAGEQGNLTAVNPGIEGNATIQFPGWGDYWTDQNADMQKMQANPKINELKFKADWKDSQRGIPGDDSGNIDMGASMNGGSLIENILNDILDAIKGVESNTDDGAVLA